MSSTLLAKDDNGNAMPVMRYMKDGGAHIVTEAAGQTSRIEFDEDTKVITLENTGKISFSFGDVNVVADTNDHTWLYPRVESISIMNPASKEQESTHLSVYFHEDATISVSERR